MVIIDKEKCTGCGRCVSDCSKLKITLEKGKAAVKEECFQCGHCVAICPEGAVSIPEYDMEDVEEYDRESFCLSPENVLHSIKFRRSIRKYKSQTVKQEDLELLVQAGRYTATAINLQSSGFVFVQEELPELKRRVWDYIDRIEKSGAGEEKYQSYLSFNQRRKANPNDDYLFRNAPVVLFITSDRILDAGMAAQNIENMAVSMGLGALYNGYLAGIAEENKELKKWLGIEERAIKACMLIGYPSRQYVRTAPRKKAHVIWR